jgi:D-alanyl-D-alanine carboxypeptidase
MLASAVLLGAGGLVAPATGRELFGSNEHVLLPPASLTKILTAMIAADWLPAHAEVPVSARAAGVSPDKVGMKAGQRWPLSIALHALLISSANDAAYALAERVSGSMAHFAVLMRSVAGQLGLTDTPVLRDPAGLDGTEGVGGGNLMSAWDVAVAARDLMAIPELAAIVGLRKYRFTGPDRIVYELYSHNRGFLDSYPGAVGVKTGYTFRAGVCVAEEASRAGRTMLAVVMNGVAPDQTAEMLLDKGFATPAKAESRDRTLPGVVRPAPEPAQAPVRTPPTTDPAGRLPRSHGPLAVAAAVPPAHQRAGLDPAAAVVPGLAGFAVLAVIGGLLLVVVSRRTRPGDAGNRR